MIIFMTFVTATHPFVLWLHPQIKKVSSSVKYGTVNTIAAKANVTKLHLTISDPFNLSFTELQPLAHLSLLTDLALQIVHKVPTCCIVVLMSNRQT